MFTDTIKFKFIIIEIHLIVFYFHLFVVLLTISVCHFANLRYELFVITFPY